MRSYTIQIVTISLLTIKNVIRLFQLHLINLIIFKQLIV